MAKIPNRVANLVAQKYQRENETFKRVQKDNPKDRIEVEIGDAKQPDFKPQAKIKRWNNEVNFSLRAQEHPDAVVRTEGKTIKYVTPDYEVHQYDLDAGDIGEDGGLEFEWVLPKKPKSNVLTATIQTKGLNFYYQPALSQEEIDEGASRPENVVGSYAVYHESKGGLNRADGMEYKTGKAFHIYRPKAIDANGDEQWCDLNIDEQAGVLTVTVDDAWLNKAVYPVKVDPTFGYTSAGASSTTITTITFSSGYRTYFKRYGSRYYMSDTGNTVDSISAYVQAERSNSVNIYMYLNDEDSAGSGQHDEIDGGVHVQSASETTWMTATTLGNTIPVGWNILNIASNSYAGTYPNASTNIFFDSSSSSGRYLKAPSYVVGYPSTNAIVTEDPFTQSSETNSYNISIYATYTASGGTATNDTRSAEITGHSTSNSTRDAELTGEDTSNSTRSSELTGHDTSNSERGSELTGHSSTNSTRDSELTGYDTATSTRSAETTGHSTANSERTSEITGSQTSNSERGAEITGGYVTPQYLYWSKLNIGSNQVESVEITETEVTTPGDSSIAWHASPDGGSTWESVTAGSLHTFTANGTDLRVRATLNATTDLSQTPTLTRVTIVWDESITDQSSSDRLAELTGYDTTSDTRSAELTGYNTESSQRGAELTGEGGTASNRDAELTGSTTANSTRSAELTGEITTSSTRSAETTGYATTSSTRSAELTGSGTPVTSERSAELTGELVLGSNNQKSYQQGNVIIPLGYKGMAYWNTENRPSGVKAGTYGFNITTNNVEIYNGTSWRILHTTTAF